MLIHSASQLLTLSGGPQRGHDLGRLNLIENGAVLIRDGKIITVGRTAELSAAYPHEDNLDASGHVVMPGFVDPHTHAIWAGDRAIEFDMRLQGKTYLEILAAGGGILSTVRATRQASLSALVEETRSRLRTMFSHGTTTAEVKTGYGLQTAAELCMLQAILTLDAEGPLEIAITFLGAHAIPPDFQSNPDGYTALICNEMLPGVHEWWEAHATLRPLPFVDVFCETGAFNLEQSRKILETAHDLGFPLKIHADEFDNLGGTSLAVELGAVSADHLVKPPLRISPPWLTAIPLQLLSLAHHSAWQRPNTLQPKKSSTPVVSLPWLPTSIPVPPGVRACSLPSLWHAVTYA